MKFDRLMGAVDFDKNSSFLTPGGLERNPRALAGFATVGTSDASLVARL